jgi:hypothetical protein
MQMLLIDMSLLTSCGGATVVAGSSELLALLDSCT